MLGLDYRSDPLQLQRVPVELRELRAWLVWELEPDPDPTKKPRKVPCYVSGGRRKGKQAGREDRARWATFDAALNRFNRGGMAGIGIATPPDLGFVALDFDDAVGREDDLLRAILASTYSELSPSGQGYRAFVRGSLMKNSEHATPERYGVEIFSETGFVTVTGNQLEGSPDTVAAIDQVPALAELIEQRFGTGASKATSGSEGIVIPEPRQGVPLDEVREMLEAISEGNVAYHKGLPPGADTGAPSWLGAGMALHHEYAETDDEEAALELWIEWSSTAPNFGSAEECRYKWSTFTRSGDGHEIKISAIEAWAKAAGWLPGQAGDDADGWVSLHDLDENPPPPREWLLEPWLPLGTVALLSGRGGTGKSLLSQQLVTAVATGAPILGGTARQGAAVMYAGEDDADEIRRRQVAIDSALFTGGRLPRFIESRVGKQSLLATFDRAGVIRPSNLWKAIKDQAIALGARLVVLDNISQMFGGDQNVGAQVSQFVKMLESLAIEGQCTVLLLGHTAKGSDDYLGSIYWEANVRARMLMRVREDGLRELIRPKVNYAATGATLLEYRHGVLHQVDSVGVQTDAVSSAKGEVLEALRVLTGRQINVSNKPQARNNLVKVGTDQGLIRSPRGVVDRALAALIDDGIVEPNGVLPWRDSQRHPARGLVLREPL